MNESETLKPHISSPESKLREERHTDQDSAYSSPNPPSPASVDDKSDKPVSLEASRIEQASQTNHIFDGKLKTEQVSEVTRPGVEKEQQVSANDHNNSASVNAGVEEAGQASEWAAEPVDSTPIESKKQQEKTESSTKKPVGQKVQNIHPANIVQQPLETVWSYFFGQFECSCGHKWKSARIAYHNLTGTIVAVPCSGCQKFNNPKFINRLRCKTCSEEVDHCKCEPDKNGAEKSSKKRTFRRKSKKENQGTRDQKQPSCEDRIRIHTKKLKELQDRMDSLKVKGKKQLS